MRMTNYKRKWKRWLLMLSSFTLLTIHVMAQTTTQKVSGKIVNETNGAPVPNATITIKGTKTFVMTDANGNFSIDAAKGSTIIITSTGFDETQIKLTGASSLDVRMKEQYKKLDELVVIGYGKMKKTDLSSAQVSISSAEINKTVNTTIDQALQGRAAGVYVTQNSGQPGGGISVNIRGISTLTGTTQPLYVIDGVQIQPPLASGNFASTNPLAGINPADIESMEILQGPSATAIYGTKATNGVILITTKKGKQNQKLKLSYNFLTTLQSKPEELPVLDLREWATMKNLGDSILGYQQNIMYSDPSILGEGTNWQDAMFKASPLFKHQVSATGGTKKTTYYTSAEYFKQDGVATGSDFKRYSFRANVDHQAAKWLKLGLSGSAWSTDENLSATNEDVIRDALNTAPNLSVKNPDGTWSGATTVEYGSNAQYAPRNPIAMASIIKNRLERDGLLGGVYAEARFLKNFTFRTSFDGNTDKKSASIITPEFFFGLNNNNPQETRFTEKGTNYYWNFNQLLQYGRALGKRGQHWVSAMASHEAQAWHYEGTPRLKNMTTGVITGTDYAGSGALESYLGRVNYVYDDKYILQFAVRTDGSANFTEGNRWGWFPSGSVAWKVSKEKLFENINWLNEFKLRAEYGATGSPYESGIYTTYGPIWTGFDTAYKVEQYGNPSLTWELTKTKNIGFNLSMFKNRVQIEADYFIKNTDNLLYRNNGLPAYLGTTGQGAISSPIVNFGTLKTTGYGISISTVNIDDRANDFSWRTNVNLSHFDSKMQSVFGGRPLYSEAWWLNDFTAQAAVGQAPWLFYGYVAEKLFESTSEIDKSAVPAQSDGVTRLPTDQVNGVWIGDIKYKDINSDGIINEKDQTQIGNPWPKYTFGITNSFSYKDFDLSILITGTQGNDLFNYIRYTNSFPNNVNLGRNLFDEAFDFARLSADGSTLLNPGTLVPRITAADVNGNGKRITNLFVEDGSFVRIKNVSLGYNVPSAFVRKSKVIKGVRLQAGIQNLATFTRYKGYDPEIGTYVGKNAGGIDRIFQGVDGGRYPLTRTYTFSMNVDF